MTTNENTKARIEALRLLVVVPTYDNGGTIGAVVESVRTYTDHLLVVNDGSTDRTQEILDAAGVDSVSYQPNRGKGNAIQTAFAYARERGYRYVLTLDADGQHYASDIPAFIEAVESTPDALIVGARNLNAENMPSKNTFANKFSNFWYRVETGQQLTDTQSGFRLYPIERLGKMRCLTPRYEFEVEVLVRAAWRGITVRNIPIHVYYPPQEERVSHFKPGKDFTRISILNSVLVLYALFCYYPWKFMHALTRKNIRQFFDRHIIHTPESNLRIASAVGLGIFFGIVPLWGYQMIAAGVTAHLVRLNKVITILASNISIPPMIPLILYGSFCTGAWVLGRDLNISLSRISLESVYQDLMQYICGSVVFAVLCGGAIFLISWLLLTLFRPKNNG